MKLYSGHLLKKSLEEGKHLIRTFLYHPSCLLCHAPLAFRDEKFLCRDCRSQFHIYTGARCRVCGKFMDGSNELCGTCIVSPPPFLLHRSFSAYEDPLKRLLHLYKYRGIEPIKYTLSCFLMETYFLQIRETFDLIIPVPMDPGRRREFFPAGDLACLLSRKLSLPYHSSILIKVKTTLPQATLTQKDRQLNLKGVFSADRNYPLEKCRILLIDDVYTTGTTIHSCASVLREKGALVSALTIAQSIRGKESE